MMTAEEIEERFGISQAQVEEWSGSMGAWRASRRARWRSHIWSSPEVRRTLGKS